MKRILLIALFLLAGVSLATAQDTVLRPADLAKQLPATVYFRGQTAPVQARNSGGVRFADGMYMFAADVDSAGYSSAIQQKYQAYLITDVAIDFSGKTLPAGAYGVGFLPDHHFVVQDLGAHDLLTVDSADDKAMTRPRPLQVMADPSSGKFRLYAGRSYVTFSRKAD